MTAQSFTLKAEQTGTERPVNPAADSKPTDQNERPQWLDQKFKTPEQMADSYRHLEAELTRLRQGKAPEPEKKADEQKPQAEAKPEGDEQKTETSDEDKKADEVADDLKGKGIDVDAMSARFWENGKIADEDRTVLVEALKDDFGDSAESLLDAFAQAQKEAYEFRVYRTYEPLGGQEKGKALIEWAKANLPEGQKEAINSLWDSGDVSKMVEGSKLVASLYAQANGSKPARVLDGTPAASVEPGYGSREEMSADMRDPRYRSDPAFQRKVLEKLSRTTAF